MLYRGFIRAFYRRFMSRLEDSRGGLRDSGRASQTLSVVKEI